MPNRSTKDEIQGTLHRFAQSMGLSPRDTDDTPAGTPTAPPPKVDPPAGVAGAADKLKGQQSVIDKQIADAGG
jgi:hypothetical protein